MIGLIMIIPYLEFSSKLNKTI